MAAVTQGADLCPQSPLTGHGQQATWQAGPGNAVYTQSIELQYGQGVRYSCWISCSSCCIFIGNLLHGLSWDNSSVLLGTMLGFFCVGDNLGAASVGNNLYIWVCCQQVYGCMRDTAMTIQGLFWGNSSLFVLRGQFESSFGGRSRGFIRTTKGLGVNKIVEWMKLTRWRLRSIVRSGQWWLEGDPGYWHKDLLRFDVLMGFFYEPFYEIIHLKWWHFTCITFNLIRKILQNQVTFKWMLHALVANINSHWHKILY